MRGKTHIEMYGEEKAREMYIKNSFANSGENNANYKGTWHGTNPALSNKGKIFEEIHGEEKSRIIKNKISLKVKGDKNPMYGKPSPNGSGNGWSGWYKNWFFKSLLELSFLIKYVNRFNFSCHSAENKKFRIKYLDFENVEKNYFPDFILNDKYLIEIKPAHMCKSIINTRKKEAAILFCEKNNLKYKMITPKKLTSIEIKNLIESNNIELIDRYKIKYKEWLKTH